MATCTYLLSTVATCSLLLLPTVYYCYLQSTIATYSLLWLPAVYSCSLLLLPTVYYSYLQSTLATCMQSTMAIPVVYYGYTYSLPSVLSSHTATLLCQPIVFIITGSVLLCLYYLVNLPMLLSAVLTITSIIMLSGLRMTIQSAMPK